MKTVMVSGADGQLVTDILKTLQKEGDFHAVAYNRSELDVTDKVALETEFKKINPDFFIQGASYHVVEEINKNPKEACDVNVASLHYLSDLCNEYDCTLINFSTNYVFSGGKAVGFGHLTEFPRIATIDSYKEIHEPHPINLYGILKLTGERVVSSNCEKYYNIRVGGLFGKAGSRAKNGKNFPYIIIDSLEKNGTAEVVADQIVNVSYTVDLAAVIVEMMKQNGYFGTYHLVNKGACTWYDVAKEINSLLGRRAEDVVPVETKDFYTNLKRPIDTSLSVYRIEDTFKVKIPTWQSGIHRFLCEIGKISS